MKKPVRIVDPDGLFVSGISYSEGRPEIVRIPSPGVLIPS